MRRVIRYETDETDESDESDGWGWVQTERDMMILQNLQA